MDQTYKFCQSCSMPMKKDPGQGGTNADGSKSSMYCSYCYKGGSFMSPDMTAKQMQEFVKAKLKEMGFPSLVAWFYTLNIPRLARWKR